MPRLIILRQWPGRLRQFNPLAAASLASVLIFIGRIHPANAQTTYQNPVIVGDHPDPSIIRTGKDFWATCTSSEWGPQFPLLHSADLVNWKLTGSVFPHRSDWAVGNFGRRKSPNSRAVTPFITSDGNAAVR